MKGDRNLKKALEIKRMISKYPSLLSSSEKDELYWKGFDLIKKSAYTGNPKAMYEYAQQFDSISFLGMENPLFSPKKCIYWYTKSAKLLYAEAYNNLADFYERGVGVKQDLRKSYELYKRGAELGSKLAKLNLKIFDKQIKRGKYKL